MESYKDKYLDHLIRIKAVSNEYARTVRGRLNKLIQFLKDMGVKEITDVTRDDLSKYQDMIMKKNVVKPTKRDELLAIALFFRFLHDYEYIEENPALIIDPPKKIHHLPRDILGEHEIAYLLSLPDKNDLLGVRNFCIMSLLYSSMVRPKEIFNLKLDAIDLRLKQVLVKRPKNRRDRQRNMLRRV